MYTYLNLKESLEYSELEEDEIGVLYDYLIEHSDFNYFIKDYLLLNIDIYKDEFESLYKVMKKIYESK